MKCKDNPLFDEWKARNLNLSSVSFHNIGPLCEILNLPYFVLIFGIWKVDQVAKPVLTLCLSEVLINNESKVFGICYLWIDA